MQTKTMRTQKSGLRCPAKTEISHQRAEKFYALALLWFAVSFLGWCAETLHFLLRWHDFTDRGFLIMPLCPIYGFSLCTIYLIAGTPENGRLRPLFRKAQKLPRFARAAAVVGLFILYFLFAALFSTAAEFATAALFDKIFSVTLWDYGYKRFHFSGYVSLDQTLLWGASVTLVMAVVCEKLLKCIQKIPPLAAKYTAAILLAAAGADFLFNLIYLCATGVHLVLY